MKVEFRCVKTGFVVSFRRPAWEGGEGLEAAGWKSKRKIIEIIVRDPVTILEISVSLGMSVSGVEKILRSLKKEKRLRRIGPDKGVYWEVPGKIEKRG
ncbi:MAG: winged helix-turn-helix domain-containing protein [Candidatus Omnitrophica bacterium]|nr:winged helix-turn-helix domain-containing protein [Candidatus Omnitrophota bacterium]